MLDQLRQSQRTRPQTGIFGVDLKDNPFDDLTGLDLSCKLVGRTHHDATID
jgi:hypothetical protein